MLQDIREKTTGVFAAVLLGLIAFSLIATFGNIDTGFSGVNTAASVNGEKVPLSEFRSIYQRQRQQWETNYRTQIPPDVAKALADNTIQNIVQGRSIAQHAREQGYRISDADVVDSIEANEAFYVGGQFSQPNYEQMLASEGMSTLRYEFEARQNLELAQFAEGVAYSAFFTPAEFRRYIELDGERRTVEFALLSPQQWLPKVVISDEAIAERFAATQGQYQTEESAALEYIVVDFAELLADTGVTDADVRDYFEANVNEFQGPDERLASHILLARGDDLAAAGELAAELKQRLDAGEAFAALAEEFSADTGSASAGGSLGWLGLGDAPAEAFEVALFELGLGEISAPIETEFGYHLIQLDDLRQGSSLNFAEVEASLAERLRDDAAADRYGELLDELDERALESLDGLAPVAEAMGLELGSVERFTRTGGEPFGFAPELVDVVFSLEVLEDGENSPVVALEEGRAVVVQVTSYSPSEQQPLDAVSAVIKAELAQEEAIALTAITGKQLLDRLQAGDEPDAVLGPVGAELEQRDSLARGDASVPGELAAVLFQAAKPVGGVADYMSVLLASGEFAIYRVKAVEKGRPEFFTQEDRDSRKEQLANRMGAGQLTAIVESLVQGADVILEPDLFETELGGI